MFCRAKLPFLFSFISYPKTTIFREKQYKKKRQLSAEKIVVSFLALTVIFHTSKSAVQIAIDYFTVNFSYPIDIFIKT